MSPNCGPCGLPQVSGREGEHGGNENSLLAEDFVVYSQHVCGVFSVSRPDSKALCICELSGK